MPERRVTVWVQKLHDRAYLALQWYDPVTGARKSRSTGTSDPEEAEGRRKDLEYELTHGTYAEASRMTWERFRELFEAEYVAGVRENTRENYAVTFGHFERLCSPARLTSINERTLGAFVAGLRKLPGRGAATMMPSTIKIHVQNLRAALRWAAGQGLLPKCPKVPAVKVPKKTPQPVPAEAFEKLLEKAQDPLMRAYLLCGWLAGLRLAEAAALEWGQTDKAPYLDVDRNRVVLPAELVKGDKDQWVPLDPDLRDALEALPRRGRKVFPFVDRLGRPVGATALTWRVKRLARAAGVKLSMRALRRGFGCRYAARVSTHVLKQLMRHASINTTLDYYANVDEAVEEAVLGPHRDTTRSAGRAGGGHGDEGGGVSQGSARSNGDEAG